MNTNNETKMELLVGPPLGKLARWLRILGFDTEYDASLNMQECINYCQEYNRIFITRSNEANKRAEILGIQSFVIKKTNISDQLKELSIRGIKLPKLDIGKARCSLCNGKILLCTASEVKALIPEGSKKRYQEFYRCNACNQPYWEGSHWIRIRETIEGI